MALSILDGNQTATTLSTILSSGQHITAHTVVSLGTQAITDMRSAVSGSVVSISNFPASQSTTFGAVTGSVSVLNFPASQAVTFTDASLTNTQLRASAVTVGGTVTVGNSVTVSSLPAISGTVGVNGYILGLLDGDGNIFGIDRTFPISGTVTAGNLPIYNETDTIVDGAVVGSIVFNVNGKNAFGASGVTVGSIPSLAAGTNRIGVVTIGGGTVTIGAGTQQIGSVTASISNFPATQAVSLTTLPALVAGTAQIGSVTVGNTVTIAGTVTANPTGTQTIAGSVTLGASTSQIGSVTASISGTVPISISSVTVGNSVTIGSLPAISGTVTANIAISSTAITSGSFTSLTSATLVPANTARKMATVYNLGTGQLFVNAGASATTLGGGFMVALSSGDFYECNYTTTTLSAIFATAGTASWMSH